MNSLIFGRLLNALKLSAGKEIHIANSSSMHFDLQDNFTISVLVKINTDYFCNFLDKGNEYTSTRVTFGFVTNNQFVFKYTNRVGASERYSLLVTTPANAIVGREITVDLVKFNANPVVSISPTEWKVYLNGILQDNNTGEGSNFTPADNVANTDDVIINSSFGSTDVIYKNYKIFNRALTADEIKQKHLKEGKWKPNDNSLIVDFAFIEKNGKALKDNTPFNNNGVLIGFTDVETASAGNLQSGNTVWQNAYNSQPITV